MEFINSLPFPGKRDRGSSMSMAIILLKVSPSYFFSSREENKINYAEHVN